jgi:hypothetical protein
VNFVYHVPAPPSVVAERLGARVDEEGPLYAVAPGLIRGARFVGRVSSERFEIGVRRTGGNSVAPRVFGRIEATDTGSTIHVFIGVSRNIRRGLLFLTLAPALTSVPVLLSVGYPVAIGLGVPLGLIVLGFVLYRTGARDVGMPRSEATELKEMLDATLLPTDGDRTRSAVSGGNVIEHR